MRKTFEFLILAKVPSTLRITPVDSKLKLKPENSISHVKNAARVFILHSIAIFMSKELLKW